MRRASKKLKKIIKSPNGRRTFIIIGSIFIIICLIMILLYFMYTSKYQSTDDAFIDGHITQIGSKVPGNIIKIYVKDNQKVKKGDLLLEIDPRDYQADLEQAKGSLFAAISRYNASNTNIDLTKITSIASVKQADAGVNIADSGIQVARQQVSVAINNANQAKAKEQEARSNVTQSSAQISSARSDQVLADENLRRFQTLYTQGAVSRQELDVAIANSQAANSRLKAAIANTAGTEYAVRSALAATSAANKIVTQTQAQLAQAIANTNQAVGRLEQVNTVPQNVSISKSQLAASKGDIQQLSGLVKSAQLKLSYTKIYAPISGYVTRKAAEKGAYIQIGQALLAIVPQNVWVIANYKETQLNNIKPGQKVYIKVDAYPHKIFKGHVDSIQHGSGARFSLLPPENAVGSYVKVVQRVPVKILFDDQACSSCILAPGMSVVPEIKIK